MASSTSFLAIFWTPSRNSFDVRETEGLRSRASNTAAKSLSSESVMSRALSRAQRMMPTMRSRTMTRRCHQQKNPRILSVRCGKPLSRRQSRKQRPPVDAASLRIDQILRMRHQAEDIESLVEHAGNIVLGAVRIRCAVDIARGAAIAERSLSVALDRPQSLVVRFVISLAVCDGEL